MLLNSIEIKECTVNEIKNWSTTCLAEKFYHFEYMDILFKKYLDDKDTNSYDLLKNTLKELENIKKSSNINKSNLIKVEDEIQYRIENNSKKVKAFDKNNKCRECFVLKKTNHPNDKMIYVFKREDNNSYKVYFEGNFVGFKFDRKEDGTINWIK